MRKLILLAGVAALAASMPAIAKERDRGGGHGRGHAAHADRHGGDDRAERGRGRDREVRRGERRNAGRADRQLSPEQRRAERAIERERRAVRQARTEDRRAWRGDDDRRSDRRAQFVDRRDWRGWAQRPVSVDRFDGDFVRFRPHQPVGFGRGGCPPGLAKQNRFCMPPGQLRHARHLGQRMPIASWPYNVPVRYRYRFVDGDRFFYRYGNDGAVYRFDRATGLVRATFPIVSNGLFIGEPLPLGYDVYNVPFAYRPFYADTSNYLYRYDGNAIYRVNSDSMLVDGIVALLAGGGGLAGLGVGDRMPLGYDVYNVPFAYRDTYYDTNDWMYRYADGSIYRVDPETQLIAAVISLLT